MTTHLSHRVRRATLGVVAATAMVAFVPTAGATPLGSGTCVGAGTVADPCLFDLYALPSTLTLTQAYVVDRGLPTEHSYTTLPTWVFSSTSTAPAGVGGPTIVVAKGMVVSITLHNGLGSGNDGLSLAAPQLPGLHSGTQFGSDKAGIGNGATRTYTFTASRPGTFLYEAGPAPLGTRAIAMGLSGAIVVKGTDPLKPYDELAATVNDEAVLALSEVDPALNLSALADGTTFVGADSTSHIEPLAAGSPATFDMGQFEPAIYLVNGSDRPANLDIGIAAGQKLLLRYLNAGAENHAMSVLGVHQQKLAFDGLPFRNLGTALDQTFAGVVQPLAAGSTADTLVDVPATAPAGMRFPVYDTGKELDVEGSGMLRYVHVDTSASTASLVCGSTSGPAIQHLAIASAPSVTTTSPARSDGTLPLVAGGAAVVCNGATLTAATNWEWWIDSGTHTPGAGGTINITLPVAAMSPGTHHLRVRTTGLADGSNGAITSVAFVIDQEGPTLRKVKVDASAGDSTGDVSPTEAATSTPTLDFTATANDEYTGGSSVVAYYATVDGQTPPVTGSPDPAGTAAVDTPDALVSVSGPPFTTGTLTEGVHTLHVWAKDEVGNWTAAGWEGAFEFTVDTTPPVLAASNVHIDQGQQVAHTPITIDANHGTPYMDWVITTPATNNGSLRYDPSEGSIRVRVSGAVDAGTTPGTIVAARGRFDDASAPGVAPAKFCTDSATTGPSFGARLDPRGYPADNGEDWFAYVPLSALNPLLTAADKTLSGRQTFKFWFRVQDSAGNWSACAGADEIIDRSAPTAVVYGGGITVGALAQAGARSKITASGLKVRVTSADTNGAITYGEWFEGNDPGRLHATPLLPSDGSFGGSTETLVSIASLAHWRPGTHTIYARVRDAAGNWSPIATTKVTVSFKKTATFTFEKGLRGLKATGRVSASRTAALDGRRGLSVKAGRKAAYVTATALRGAATYRASFKLRTNGASTGGQWQTVFAGLGTDGSTQVSVQRITSDGFEYVRLVAKSSDGLVTGRWNAISKGTHRIAIVWAADADGIADLTIDGADAGTLHALANASARISTIKLGAINGLSKARGALAIDSFVSTE